MAPRAGARTAAAAHRVHNPHPCHRRARGSDVRRADRAVIALCAQESSAGVTHAHGGCERHARARVYRVGHAPPTPPACVWHAGSTGAHLEPTRRARVGVPARSDETKPREARQRSQLIAPLLQRAVQGAREGTHPARGSCVSNGVLGHVTTPHRPALRLVDAAGPTWRTPPYTARALGGRAGRARWGPSPTRAAEPDNKGQRGHGVRTYTLHQSPPRSPEGSPIVTRGMTLPPRLPVCRLSAARVVDDTTRPS